MPKSRKIMKNGEKWRKIMKNQGNPRKKEEKSQVKSTENHQITSKTMKNHEKWRKKSPKHE